MNRHLLTYKYLFFLLAVLVSFLADPGIASQRQLVYEHIDVNMILNKDTSIDVVETQRVRLSGDWNGLYRYYLLYGCDGIEILDFSENQTPYKRGSIRSKGGYIVRQEKGKINVKWRSRNLADPPYKNATTTFIIRYRITGAIGQYLRRDVLHWKPLFQDREYRINEAAVNLTLPQAVEPEQAEVIFYTKAPLAKWQFDQQDGRLIHFNAKRIDRKDKFEIKISLPKGILESYKSAHNTYIFHIKPWIFPVGTASVVVILFILWSKVGRDPAPEPQQVYSIDVLNVKPGLAGLLIDESFDVVDITATIMDLARRGYITINEIEQKKMLKPGCYEFELIKIPQEGELSDYEELLIKRLFSGHLVVGQKVSTEQLKNRFYKHIPKVKEKAWRQVRALGWFDILPKKAKMLFFIIGIIVILPSLALAAFENEQIVFFAVWGSMFAGIPGMMLISIVKRGGFKGLLKSIFFIPFVVIGLGVLITVAFKNYQSGGWMSDVGITGVVIGSLICASGGAMARKSKQGSAVMQRLDEMRDSLQRSDSMGLNIEDLLPWAIAFGVTADYLGHMTDVSNVHIPYYRSYSSRSSGIAVAESLSSVADGFSAMTSAIGSTLSSSPGGSSGGGGSGGGGGGGGGGGW